MSNKIIDTVAITATVTGGPSSTETAALVTPPQRTGTIARISCWLSGSGDTTWRIRRGTGVTGTALFTGSINGTVLTVDDSPASQYTLTATGDGSETDTGTAVIYVDQIS